MGVRRGKDGALRWGGGLEEVEDLFEMRQIVKKRRTNTGRYPVP